MAGPEVGRDAALIRSGSSDADFMMAASVSPDIAASLQERVILTVQTAVNNLAAEGAVPLGTELQILLPEDADEQDLKTIMRTAEDTAAKLAMHILGGHTAVCPSVHRSMVAVTAIGKRFTDADVSRIPLTEQGLSGKTSDKHSIVSGSSLDTRQISYADKEIVVTKSVGMAAVMLLAGEKGKELSERFTQDIAGAPLHFLDELSVLPEAKITSRDSGTLLMHDLSEGGVFGALWEMAERAGTGLDIQVRQIPIRQETVEISEVFDLNPYQSLSQGSLMILTESGEGLVQKLMEAGIPAAVIGRTTSEKARILRNRDEVRYLDKPQQDGIYSVL
ncbi:MAG: hydrogenase maturation factor [Eubacterium sp.]|nr:hydrogenase maturation factor [Eubacterium sp.]